MTCSTCKDVKKVGILFSGGPAPSANAVISAATITLLNMGYSVVGFYDGYQNLQSFDKTSPEGSFVEGKHYINLKYSDVSRIRSKGGSILRTSRANPSKVGKHEISCDEDFSDAEKTSSLRKVVDALEYLGVGALITIGGDDTLKTAANLSKFGVPVVHVPKTIDNDYFGIDWTFGYFSAIERARQDLLTYNEETKTTETFFLLEMMGRSAGWYCMGAGIAGMATKMVVPEEIEGKLDFDKLSKELLDFVLARKNAGKNYGIICIAEGLGYLLSDEDYKKLNVKFDNNNNPILSEFKLVDQLSSRMQKAYKDVKGEKAKLNVKTGTIGYTTRCVDPTAYDVILASQLGYGAAKLINEKSYGYMVTVNGQFELDKREIEGLIEKDGGKRRTKLRHIITDTNAKPGEKVHDFYKLGKALQYDPKYSEK